MAETLDVRIKAFDDFSGTFNKLHQKAGESESKLSSLGSKISTMGAVAGTAAVVGVGALAYSMVTGAGAMERYDAILTTVLGSADAAAEKLQWASTFAAKTPFELPGIMEATVKLEAYGMKAEEVLPAVGNAAAALGKPLMAAVEAVADASTGEFERLKEFGVKAVQVDKDNFEQFKLTAEDVGKTALLSTDKYGQERVDLVDRNNREMIQSTILSIWNDRYKGAMEEMSKTWEGTVSNLKDNITRMMSAAGQSIIDQVQPKLMEFMGILESPAIKTAVESLGKAFGGIAASFLDVLSKLAPLLAPIISEVADRIAPAISGVIEAMGTIVGQFITAGSEAGIFSKAVDSIVGTLDTLSYAINILSEAGIAGFVVKLADMAMKVQGLAAPFLNLINALTTLKEILGLTSETITVEGATSVGAMSNFYLGLKGKTDEYISKNRESMTGAMREITQGIVNETPISAGSMDVMMQGLYHVVNTYGPKLQEASGQDVLKMAVGISAQSGAPINEVISILNKMGTAVSAANLPGGEAMADFAAAISAASGVPIGEVQAILDQLRTDAANAGIEAPVDAVKGNTTQAWADIQAWFAERPVKVGVNSGASTADHGGGLIHQGGMMHGGGNLMTDEVPAVLQKGEYIIQRKAVKEIGLPTLNALNRGESGGGVTVNFNSTFSMASEGEMRRAARKLNEYLVSEGAR